MIIALDGLDGCGKTTYIQRLAEHYKEKGHRVKIFGNPGGTELGLKVREIIKGKEIKRHKGTDMFLLAAAVNDLLFEINEYHEDGYLVFVDRWLMSPFGYQRELNHLGTTVDFLYRFLLPTFWSKEKLPVVDLMFWIDVPYLLLKERLLARNEFGKDHYEGITEEWFNTVRNGYLNFFHLHHKGLSAELSSAGNDERHFILSQSLVKAMYQVSPTDNFECSHDIVLGILMDKIDEKLKQNEK